MLHQGIGLTSQFRTSNFSSEVKQRLEIFCCDVAQSPAMDLLSLRTLPVWYRVATVVSLVFNDICSSLSLHYPDTHHCSKQPKSCHKCPCSGPGAIEEHQGPASGFLICCFLRASSLRYNSVRTLPEMLCLQRNKRKRRMQI